MQLAGPGCTAELHRIEARGPAGATMDDGRILVESGGLYVRATAETDQEPDGDERLSDSDRRSLLFEVYRLLNKVAEGNVRYTMIHKAIHKIQQQDYDLGYKFDRCTLYGPWDDDLQYDIMLLGLKGDVDNHDEEPGVKTHKLTTTDLGEMNAQAREAARGGKYLFGKSRRRLYKELKESLKPSA